MAEQVLSVRPGGIVESLHDNSVIAVRQPVDEIMRYCHEQRALNDRLKGFRKSREYHHVAEIPLAAVEIANAQGMDILNDQEAMRRFLNDPENAAFRTSTGRV